MSSSSDLNVWTVLWVGDGPWAYSSRPAIRPRPEEQETRQYQPQDVQRYQRMVMQYLPEAKFRCLSNVAVPGVECIPLTSGMEGWWPKVELWRPDLPPGRNVYFDLDTLIVRDPAPIVNYPAPFAAIKPGPGVGSAGMDSAHESEPWKPWKDQEGFWRYPRYQTSVMVWDTAYVSKFWDGFNAEVKAHVASDQDYLGKCWPDEARMPTEWFRKMPKSGQCPPHPKLVVLTMPMRNDKAAEQHGWVRRLWH